MHVLPADRLDLTQTLDRCPLCLSPQLEPYWQDAARSYLRCAGCELVVVPPRFHLSLSEERAVYDLHENGPDDAGYRKFLGRLTAPLIARLKPGAQGLDFGSGPGPTLSLMMSEAGYPSAIYDPIYAPDTSALEARYDLISATEVVEHLRTPKQDLDRLFAMLRPGGTLAIMTKLVLNRERFSTWHYKNDPTHISFFSAQTLRWLADSWDAKLEQLAADILFITRP